MDAPPQPADGPLVRRNPRRKVRGPESSSGARNNSDSGSSGDDNDSNSGCGCGRDGTSPRELYPRTFDSSRDDDRSPTARIELYDPHTKEPTRASAVYNDPHFSFHILETNRFGPGRWDETMLPKCGHMQKYNSSAPAVLRSRGFSLDRSGIQASTEGPRALSFMDDKPKKILDDMLDILDQYLDAKPEERSVPVEWYLVPGRSTIWAEPSSYECEFIRHVGTSYFELANVMLRMCHRAVCWYAQQPQGKARKQRHEDGKGGTAHPFPVPLEGILFLTTATTGTDTVAADQSSPRGALEDGLTAIPDFALRWTHGRLHENIAVGEMEPRMKPHQAAILTTPQDAPLDVRREKRSAKRRRLEKPAKERYRLDKCEARERLFQLAAQNYLHNTTCGALIGAQGRMLIWYELHRLANDGDGDGKARFALCFAKQALYTSKPSKWDRARADEKDPDAFAQSLNETVHVDHEVGRQDGAGRRSEAVLSFLSRPGMVWGLVHWALYAFHVAVKDDCRPRAKSEELAAMLSGRPLRQGLTNEDQTDTPRPVRYAFGVPVIEDMAFLPTPFNSMKYADFYRCMPLSALQNQSGATYLATEVDSANLVLKVGRQCAHDDTKTQDICRYPRPALGSPKAGWLDFDYVNVRDLARKELRAYARLKPVQGGAVPRLLGVVPPAWAPKSHAPKPVLERVGICVQEVAEKYAEPYLAWREDIEAQVFAALRACHELGVAHGDVYPGVIFVQWVFVGAGGPREGAPAAVGQGCSGEGGAAGTAGSDSCNASGGQGWRRGRGGGHGGPQPQPLPIGPPSPSASGRARASSVRVKPPRSVPARLVTSFSDHAPHARGKAEEGSPARTSIPGEEVRLRVAFVDWWVAEFEPKEKYKDDEAVRLGEVMGWLEGEARFWV